MYFPFIIGDKILATVRRTPRARVRARPFRPEPPALGGWQKRRGAAVGWGGCAPPAHASGPAAARVARSRTLIRDGFPPRSGAPAPRAAPRVRVRRVFAHTSRTRSLASGRG
eukprot:7376593-Prymnesium_polylepis.1